MCSLNEFQISLTVNKYIISLKLNKFNSLKCINIQLPDVNNALSANIFCLM